MRMRNKNVALFGITLFVFVATLFCGKTALAYTVIEQKAFGKGIYDCYVAAMTERSEHVLVGRMTVSGMTDGYKSLILENNENYVGLLSGFGWQSINDNNVSCRELFGGYQGGAIAGGSFSGLLKRAGVDGTPSTREGRIGLLTGVFGYKASSEAVSSGGECFKVKMRVWNPGDLYVYNKESAAICNSTSVLTSDSLSVQDANIDGVLEFYKRGDVIEVAKVACSDTNDQYCQNDDGEFLVNTKFNIGDYDTFEGLMSAIGGDVARHFSGSSARVSSKRASVDPTNLLNRYSYGESNDAEYSIADTRTATNNRANASFVAANKLLGASFKRKEDLIFSDEEKYSLYNEYLKSFYEAFPPVCEYGEGVGTTEEALKNSGYTSVSYSQSGEVKKCYVKPAKHINSKNDDQDKVYGIDEQGYFGELKTFDQIVEDFSALTMSGVAGGGNIPDPQSYDINEGDKCYEAAGPVGWLACPLITTSTSLLDGVYEDIEENYLKVPAAELFGKSDNGQSGVYNAWDIFRNIANIAFIALLLFVIFSQLTGVGIDNYGIKKILPRIIVSAVLINLSYVICQIAVDISNVVGNGINSLFDKIAQDAGLAGTMGNYGANAAQYVVTFGGIGAVGLATLFISPGLVITVLLSLLSAVIAVLFLWVILITRQSGVILAVILSPLAFAFYILPNTNKVFKRWVSISKALLLLYPLCALAVGSGLLAGRVLASISTENGSMRLAAMVVQVMPYFFIPTLLKGSLAAAGNIGAKVSGLGKSLNKATVGKFASSETAKRARIGLNNSDITGLRTKFANTRFGRITGLNKVRARQLAAANKEKEENLAAGKLLQASISDLQERRDPKSVTRSKIQEQLNRVIKSGDEKQYFAVLDDAVRRFGASKSAEMHRTAINEAGGSGLMSDGKRAKFLRNSAERYDAFAAKDFGLGKYMQFGGVDKDGRLVDLGEGDFEHDVLQIGDLKDMQAATLNANSIERSMQSGLATRPMAQRLMANKQARNQMDDVQQLMWAAYAYGDASGNSLKLSKKEAEAILGGASTYEDGDGHTFRVRLDLNRANELLKPLPETVKIDSPGV